MRVARRKPRAAKIGVFGVGHYNYWPQFDGLLDEMHRKLAVFVDKVEAHEVAVTSFGLVDDAQGAYALLPKLKAAGLDLVFCDMLTYATSSTFGILVRELDVPIVLVALQPLKALDYSKASTHMQLCNDDLCSVPEFTGVAVRMGRKPPPVVLGTLHDDPIADAEIAEWCNLAKVLHDLKGARIGHFGHVLESMLDMHSDPTAFTAAFGCHIVQTEPDDLLRFGLIPELIGRLPIFATLDDLNEDALLRILREPRNALVKQYLRLFEMDGVALEFDPGALQAVVQMAIKKKTGARALRSILEEAMLDIMYELPSIKDVEKCHITRDVILRKKKPVYITKKEEKRRAARA